MYQKLDGGKEFSEDDDNVKPVQGVVELQFVPPSPLTGKGQSHQPLFLQKGNKLKRAVTRTAVLHAPNQESNLHPFNPFGRRAEWILCNRFSKNEKNRE